MLATSTRLLAALLNHADSAEWFRTFGDEEVEKTNVKEEMDAQMLGCGPFLVKHTTKMVEKKMVETRKTGGLNDSMM